MINWILRVVIVSMIVVAALYPLKVLSLDDVKYIEIGICLLAFALSKFLREEKQP